MRKYTDKELLDEIIRLKDILCRNPKQDDFPIHSKYSINAYKRAFGGLSQALIKIGEKPNIKLDCINYDIKEQILKVYHLINKPPEIEDMDNLSDISYMAIRRMTQNKSWHSVLLECGIPAEEISNKKKANITNDELKSEILRLKEKLGRYPNYYDVARDGAYSCNTYEARFGSYIKAMLAFGFTDYQNQSIYHKQTHTVGKDGFTYKSMFEAEIANYLYDKKLLYNYEQQVCKDKSWTCDFVVTLPDTGLQLWIEADGMGNSRASPYGPDNKKIKFYIDHMFKYYIIKYRKKIDKQLDSIFSSNNFVHPYPVYGKTITSSSNILLSKKVLSIMSEQDRIALIDDVFEILRTRIGFPFPDDQDEIIKEWNQLKIYNPDILSGSLYNNCSLATYICKYFCHSFYSSKTTNGISLVDVFYDDALLKKVIANRLSIGWTLKGGIHEFFNITPRMILQGIRSSGLGSSVSMFKPQIAKHIYTKYSNPGDVIYDYSAGFGGRLLGAAACGNRKYIGVDPLTAPELQNMIEYFNLTQNCTVYNSCSEDYILDENSIDFAFSSPPYYNQEIYSNDSTQAYNKGKEYFFDTYWKNTLKNIKYMLKPGKFFGVNVKNDMMVEIAKLYFGNIEDTIYLRTIRSHINKSDKYEATKNECVYIFKNIK